MAFFVSYARADEEYVELLIEHLHRASLPVWFDRKLEWGSRFTREIQRQLASALAVIVVMSPEAEQSEWVEREILESQRWDREVLPILLHGERLFLLASTHHFDARGGILPGRAELDRLRRLHERHCAGHAPPDTPMSSPNQVPATAPPPTTRPSSGRHLDRLHQVSALLKDGETELADIVTTSVILDAAGRLSAGWLSSRSGADVPYSLLGELDQLWSRATGGHHGFTAQLREYDGPAPPTPVGGAGDFFALAHVLGWKAGPHEVTPRYGEFVASTGRPPGFFPTLRNPQAEHEQMWHDHWRQTALAVHLRLRQSR